MNISATARKGHGKARRAGNGSTIEAGGRAGFVARGLIYFLVGVLALRIAFNDTGGGGGKTADRGGALSEIAQKPFGSVLLWVLGAALAGMALWRLSEAAFGAAGPDGQKTTKRLASAGRAVFYGFVSYSVLMFAAGDRGSGSGSSDAQSQDVTARVLDMPGGRWLVGAGGVAVVGAGLWIAGRAALRKFHKHLRMGEMSRTERRAVDITGVFGGVSRGLVFAVAGGFAVAAAVKARSGEAKGMDDTLRSFSATPAGPWLLALVAVGLAAFGLFSCANARWRRI
ncbi:DUF1206 domain-containing protein [Streptomyces sp. NBC_01260]|uniref:DUF1206 domain-containing protein n=1 Tax=unclassified Streptomyces TaxID=2593676 RepID=UPI000F478D98|nr:MULTISPECIES: DUF1206 domain-containing protein [unclassified Streptomyces]MCX4770198.1 DUF1206 domain-containing protein [Streptomyces sp. NBC_01285]